MKKVLIVISLLIILITVAFGMHKAVEYYKQKEYERKRTPVITTENNKTTYTYEDETMIDFTIIEHNKDQVYNKIQNDETCSITTDLKTFPASSAGNVNINIVPTSNYQNTLINPTFILLHDTESNMCAAMNSFLGESETSSHFLVSSQGQIFMMVPMQNRAWHSGESRWQYQGKEYNELNDYAIGIELENLTNYLYDYEIAEMDALIVLTKLIMQQVPGINSPEQILGHEHVSGYMGKRDPGPRFDWDYYFTGVFGEGIEFPNRKALISMDELSEYESIGFGYDSKTFEEQLYIQELFANLTTENQWCINDQYLNSSGEDWVNFILSDRSNFSC